MQGGFREAPQTGTTRGPTRPQRDLPPPQALGQRALFAGSNDLLGNQIVGASLRQVADAEVRELFAMMAVAAEDVLMPMDALELIWCGHTQQPLPLSRINRMRLRKRVFALLDRNLVLGETSTTGGIYMVSAPRSCRRESRL